MGNEPEKRDEDALEVIYSKILQDNATTLAIYTARRYLEFHDYIVIPRDWKPSAN